MIRDSRLLVCAGLSVVAHLALAKGLRHLPSRPEGGKRIVSLRVVSPPPAAEPPPEPRAAPPSPAPKPMATRVRSRVHAPSAVPEQRPREDEPPPDRPEPATGGSVGPVFGVTIESTSQAGTGPAMPVGHTSGGVGTGTDDDEGDGGPKGLSRVVPAYEVTTMPMPQGRCEGKYTPEALRAAIEGTVILDVIVGETGRVRQVRVVSGLGSGLTDAAVSAIKGCRFTPGEKDGKAVPVRIPGYKIRFLLPTDE
jgi:periplasmic protein TonB